VTRRVEEWGLTRGRLYWPRLPAITGSILAQPSTKSYLELEVGQPLNRRIRRRWDRFEHLGPLLNSSRSFCLSANLRHIDCDRPAQPRNPNYFHTLRMSIRTGFTIPSPVRGGRRHYQVEIPGTRPSTSKIRLVATRSQRQYHSIATSIASRSQVLG
jgi:hypothetical protein